MKSKQNIHYTVYKHFSLNLLSKVGILLPLYNNMFDFLISFITTSIQKCIFPALSLIGCFSIFLPSILNFPWKRHSMLHVYIVLSVNTITGKYNLCFIILMIYRADYRNDVLLKSWNIKIMIIQLSVLDFGCIILFFTYLANLSIPWLNIICRTTPSLQISLLRTIKLLLAPFSFFSILHNSK